MIDFNARTGIITATSFTGLVTGNADTATALDTGRTIGMTGDVVWTSDSFDGTGNVTGTSTIQAQAVDVAMLADGTDGELITWSSAGVAATVAVGTVSQVLTSGGAGVAPTFEDAGGGGSVIKYKLISEDRVSTVTPTDDLHLKDFAIVAASAYAIEGYVTFGGNNTAKIRFKMDYDQSDQGFEWGGHAVDNDAGLSEAMHANDISDELLIASLNVFTGAGFHFNGRFISDASNAGLLTLQWAQNVTNAGAIALDPGSWMRVTRLGAIA